MKADKFSTFMPVFADTSKNGMPKVSAKASASFENKNKQDAVGAYIWAWLYYAYDTFNIP